MSQFENKLKAWGQSLEAVHLPRWEELPDFQIYMDQLVPLINEHCAFLKMTEADKLLTPAMINNYVKLRIIPKPLKKRYSRIHLAYLLVIVLLKPVLSIQDISDGLKLQVMAFRGDYQAAYNLFCKQYERSLHHIGRLAQGNHDSRHMIDKLPTAMMGMHMATLSVASQLFAKEVLAILHESGEPLSRRGERNRKGQALNEAGQDPEPRK
ncbi:DUF1836 domain-containing protein [Peptococcus simiae]|uniref:DUF1836 domain-containing protein n=1 Tax=Peptococcus simiae TaxID=1643805 RepID=UPI00397EAB42